MLLAPLAALHAAERANVLLNTADDLGCQLSCYGEKRFETPRLDALAKQGAVREFLCRAVVVQPVARHYSYSHAK